MKKEKVVEIMSPVGSFESLSAAIQGGADAVYFGIGHLNMRSRSSVNFNIDDLNNIVSICKTNKIKAYLTLNTLVYDNELNEMKCIADAAAKAGVDAVIATDFAVLEYLKSINVKIHISTQMSISNFESVRFFAKYADVMVLARELSLNQVSEINRLIEKENLCGPSGNLIKTEIFVHGALCMAISGKCYLSLDNMNYSANRGACLQICRRTFTVKDKESDIELDIENENIMSPKDLCTIEFLDKIINAGVSVLKIEGRGRSADYVKTTTKCYKEAVNAIHTGDFSKEKTDIWIQELKTVFNRGFWDGYYLGRKLGEWTDGYGNKATRRKEYLGKVSNYFSNLGVAEIKIESGQLKKGDKLLIMGPTTGVVECCASEIRVDLSVTELATKEKPCSIKVPEAVRRNDKVYLWLDEDNCLSTIN